MQAKKKDVELDPRIFPVREQGPETGLVHLSKYYSKTCMDEHSGRAPSDVHPISQQKKAPHTECLFKWWTGQDLNL